MGDMRRIGAAADPPPPPKGCGVSTHGADCPLVKPSTDTVPSWLERHTAIASVWRTLDAAERTRGIEDAKEWKGRLFGLRTEQQELVRAGRWRGGPRTLLAALDVHYRELAMTAGPAWLLRPDGHHGLGSRLLTRLLGHLGVDAAYGSTSVRVVVEEQRDRTRADLVVYGGEWTVVVEAKVFAIEQERQLDRLWEHWGDEPAPMFVFLSRGARQPLTAKTSAGQWRPLTWRDVADLVRAAAAAAPAPAPGVHDYIATLEAFHSV